MRCWQAILQRFSETPPKAPVLTPWPSATLWGSLPGWTTSLSWDKKPPGGEGGWFSAWLECSWQGKGGSRIYASLTFGPPLASTPCPWDFPVSIRSWWRVMTRRDVRADFWKSPISNALKAHLHSEQSSPWAKGLMGLGAAACLLVVHQAFSSGEMTESANGLKSLLTTAWKVFGKRFGERPDCVAFH